MTDEVKIESKEAHHKHEHVHAEEPFNLKIFIKDSISILIGIIFASVGLELFIVPNQLLDGGVTGISLLLAFITKWDMVNIGSLLSLTSHIL